jgi:hypothetical protein
MVNPSCRTVHTVENNRESRREGSFKISVYLCMGEKKIWNSQQNNRVLH